MKVLQKISHIVVRVYKTLQLWGRAIYIANKLSKNEDYLQKRTRNPSDEPRNSNEDQIE